MRRIVIGFVSVVLIVAGITGFYNAYGIAENTLYSEEIFDVAERPQGNEDTLVTRMEALEIAYGVFGQGLGISLLDLDLSMNMNLYYDKADTGTYKWAMSWIRESTLDTYSCTIDAMDGRLLNLYVSEVNEEAHAVRNDAITKKEAIHIITPFLKAIELDPAEYAMEFSEDFIIDDGQVYKRCNFKNKKNAKDCFIIDLDEDTRTIVLYGIDIGE